MMRENRNTSDRMIGGVTGVAALFLIITRFGFGGEMVTSFTLALILTAMSLRDIRTLKIPNYYILLLLLPAIMSFFLGPPVSYRSRLIGFAAVSVPMIFMNMAVKGSFGGGDIKLMAVCGIILGWKGIWMAMFFGTLTGGIYAISLIATGKIKRGGHFAFGPFLALGIMVSLLYGDQFLRWYLGFF